MMDNYKNYIKVESYLLKHSDIDIEVIRKNIVKTLKTI